VFSELVIIIGVKAVANLPLEVALFDDTALDEWIQALQIGVCTRGPGFVTGEGTTGVGGALDSATAEGLLDFLDSPPTIRSVPFTK
jgi:hypothetical protein